MRAFLLPLLAALVLAGCGEPATKSPGTTKVDAGDLGLEATDETGVLLGVVVDPSLRPIAGATVTAGLNATGDLTALTNADGAFGFDGLAPGLYIVRAGKPGWNATQVVAPVVAGVSDPEALRVVLLQDTATAPFVAYAHSYLKLNLATNTGPVTFTAGGFTGNGTYGVGFELAPGAQWFQGEAVWEPQTQTSGAMDLFCGVFVAGATEYLATNRTMGPAPLAAPVPVPAGSGADRAYCEVKVGTGDIPVGFAGEQPVDLFSAVFYNFPPQAGWTFVADGEHPLP